MENKTLIIGNETVFDSIMKDLATFSFMALCIYISKDSTFWTFVSGILFLLFFFGKVATFQGKVKKFNTEKDAIEYLQKGIEK